jgi:RNA polymerase sigma factor for flagellar operon FliA
VSGDSHLGDLVDREKLILDHIPLLRHIVGRMALDLPGSVERDDLFGWGMLGLIGAADSFEPGRGLKFSTFAFTRIRGAVLDELRRADFLPRGRREKVRGLEGAISTLEQSNGVVPTPEEIAQHMGVSIDDVDEILLSARSAGTASLDDGPGCDLLGLLSDPRSDDPQGSAEWEETRGLLVAAIQALPEQDKTVVTLYYGEELLLREIAEVLGVTESRVSQIHSRALYRLNRQLSARRGSPA